MHAVQSVSVRRIQGLWTGMGGVDEITATSPNGDESVFIVKVIGIPKDLENHEYKRDHTSYFVEANFYEKGHADRLCAAGALCPRPLLTGTDDGILRICMTKLPGEVFDGSVEPQIRSALLWLARLHATYWGAARADKAVASGLQPQGCYWHFDTRQKEYMEMSQSGIDGRHRLAARGLDERLKADCMQTICHGDAKAANIMFDTELGVSFFDFQWTGKAPPTKDLAYFLACAVSDADASTEERYLRHYFQELSALLAAQGDRPPTFEIFHASYVLACVDLARWMAGWSYWGNKQLLKGHVQAVLDLLDQGDALESESAYQERIFAIYPPRAQRSPSRARAAAGHSANSGRASTASRAAPGAQTTRAPSRGSTAAATHARAPGAPGAARASAAQHPASRSKAPAAARHGGGAACD